MKDTPEIVRVQLDSHPAFVETVDELCDQFGMTSRKAVYEEGFLMLLWLMNTTAKGHRLAVINDKQQVISEFSCPMVERARIVFNAAQAKDAPKTQKGRKNAS